MCESRLIITMSQGMNLSLTLLEKKENIHSNIRKEAKKEVLGEMRRQLMKCLDRHLLDIIRTSEQGLSQEVIEDLVRHANSDSQNAIIQIGNLIIDDPRVALYIHDRLLPLQNDYWGWLLNVMALTKAPLKRPLLDWLLVSLNDSTRTTTFQGNCMEALSELTKEEHNSCFIAYNTKFMTPLCRMLLSPLEGIYTPAFNILANLVSFNDNITASIIQTIGHKLPEIIKSGLMKAEHTVRLYAAEILSNLALNKYVPVGLTGMLIAKSTKERGSVVRELSFFFLNASKQCDFVVLEDFVEKGLINTLLYYLSGESGQLQENGILTIKNIFQRLSAGRNQEGLQNFYSFLVNNSVIDILKRRCDVEGRGLQEYLLS